MKNYVLLSVLLTAAACQEPSFTSEVIPVLGPPEVSGIDTSGVTFSSRAWPVKEEVVDFGFVWGPTADLPADSLYRTKVSLGNRLEKQNYSVRIDRDLLPGRSYKVRFYVNTGEHWTYSQPRVFESKGSTWNPWQRVENMDIPFRLPETDYRSTTIDGRTYLIGENYIHSFDPGDRSWTTTGAPVNLDEVLFIDGDKAYCTFDYSGLDDQIGIVNIRTGEIGRRFPLPEPLLYYPWSFFGFCVPPYCYACLEVPSSGVVFWKFNPETMQGIALNNLPPDLFGINGKVLRWQDKIFVWAQEALWEYLPDATWEGKGRWDQRTTFPGPGYGPSLLFLSGDRIVAGHPFENAPFYVYDDLWEYSLTEDRWGKSHFSPVGVNYRVEWNIPTSEGPYLVFFRYHNEWETWHFEDKKLYPLD